MAYLILKARFEIEGSVSWGDKSFQIRWAPTQGEVARGVTLGVTVVPGTG